MWLRHNIETRYKRLMYLEQHAQGDTVILSDTQIRLLERHSVDLRCRHVETSRPGELLNQDTFYGGTLKGVDEIRRDLDRFMRYYNLERSHQGYRLKGRTPAPALMEALGVSESPEIIPTPEVTEPLPTAA